MQTVNFVCLFSLKVQCRAQTTWTAGDVSREKTCPVLPPSVKYLGDISHYLKYEVVVASNAFRNYKSSNSVSKGSQQRTLLYSNWLRKKLYCWSIHLQPLLQRFAMHLSAMLIIHHKFHRKLHSVDHVLEANCILTVHSNFGIVWFPYIFDLVCITLHSN